MVKVDLDWWFASKIETYWSHWKPLMSAAARQSIPFLPLLEVLQGGIKWLVNGRPNKISTEDWKFLNWLFFLSFFIPDRANKTSDFTMRHHPRSPVSHLLQILLCVQWGRSRKQTRSQYNATQSVHWSIVTFNNLDCTRPHFKSMEIWWDMIKYGKPESLTTVFTRGAPSPFSNKSSPALLRFWIIENSRAKSTDCHQFITCYNQLRQHSEWSHDTPMAIHGPVLQSSAPRHVAKPKKSPTLNSIRSPWGKTFTVGDMWRIHVNANDPHFQLLLIGSNWLVNWAGRSYQMERAPEKIEKHCGIH